MGAFDTYRGSARCPACGDIHHIYDQTKVFDPDFFDGLFNREFVAGRSHSLGFAPLRTLAAGEWDDWWRVRDRGEPGRIAMLAHTDCLFGCSCGQPLAMTVHFECSDEPPTAALLSIELLDAFAEDLAARIDLASSDGMIAWTGDHRALERERDDLQRADFERRAARVREAILRRFEGHERWLNPPDEPGWTHLVGPVTCEHCGIVRARTLSMALSHPNYSESVLGEGWDGGVLREGTRIRGAMDWRTVDEDRGYFLRLRSAVSEHTLTLSGRRESWECGCGAGRACVLLRLRVDEDGAVVEALRLRSPKRVADLDDVDYVYSPGLARGRLRAGPVGWRPRDREEAIAGLVRAWGLI